MTYFDCIPRTLQLGKRNKNSRARADSPDKKPELNCYDEIIKNPPVDEEDYEDEYLEEVDDYIT